MDLVKFAMSKFVHYKNKLTQVLDHEADFGGLTGWCRAVVDTKCSPIDQQVILTPSWHQIQILTHKSMFLMLLNVLETKLALQIW